MISDTLDRLGVYRAMIPELQAVEEFLRTACDRAEGRYDLDGGVRASITSYKTRPLKDLTWEVHEKHIDVQVVLSGQECLCWVHKKGLSDPQPYLEEVDFTEWKTGESTGIILLDTLNFALLFPWDGHMPKCEVNRPQKVKKAVFKIPVSTLQNR